MTRRNNWPTSRHGICRRPSWRSHDHAVGRVSLEQLVIDRHVNPYGVAGLLFFQHCFIECTPNQIWLIFFGYGHLQQHSLIDDEVAPGLAVQGRSNSLDSAIDAHFSEITQHPDVDPQHWHGCTIEQTDGAQHCAVATQDHDEVRIGCVSVTRHIDQTVRLGISATHPQMMTRAREFCTQFAQQRGHFIARMVGHHHDIGHVVQAIRASGAASAHDCRLAQPLPTPLPHAVAPRGARTLPAPLQCTAGESHHR